MKEKIFAAIKAKFPKVNLSKKRLEAIAAKIEGKIIDDETKIDAAIDEFNDFNPLADMAKADDQVRNLEAKLKIAAAAPKDKDKETPEPVTPPDDAPDWAKAMMKQNETLASALAAIQGDKTKTAIQSKVKANEKLKGVPEVFYSKRLYPEKEDEIETFVDEVLADFTALNQERTDAGLSILGVPKGGSSTQTTTPAKGVSPEVKKFVEAQKAADEAAAKSPQPNGSI